MPLTRKMTASRRLSSTAVPQDTASHSKAVGAPNPARQAAYAAYSATGRFQ